MADKTPMEIWLSKMTKEGLIRFALELNRERNMYRDMCDMYAEEGE